MSEKTINLLPSHRIPELKPLRAVPSVVVTLVIAGAVAMAGFLLDPKPPAHATSDPRPNPSPRSSLCRVPHSDDAATAVARAAGWYPWHELLVEIPHILGEDACLKWLTYTIIPDSIVPNNTTAEPGSGATRSAAFGGGRGTVVLTGEIERVSQVAEIMLSLENIPWLSQPVPQTVRRDEESGTTHFSLELGVLPFLTLEEHGEGE